MKVCEIFYSISGEGMFQGYPAAFIRFANCNLRCKYCDTKYFVENRELSIYEILKIVTEYNSKIVVITGGEPLLQDERDLTDLMALLLHMGYTIDVETNGTKEIIKLPHQNLHYTVDIKCPCSGHEDSFNEANLKLLDDRDEVKFVVQDEVDFEFSKRYLDQIHCPVIYSPVFGKCDLPKLAEFCKSLGNVKMQLQLHKIIYPNIARGV